METALARLNASVKAPAARSCTTPPLRTVLAIPAAAPMESSPWCRTPLGSPMPERSIPARYALFTMLPKMAMPSAPPSSRVVSFTADPTPAFVSGTALMISLVAGAAVRLMPVPRAAKVSAITR